MKCNEIMSTDLKVCTGEDSAVNVAKMMKEKDVGPIPVVTKTEMELVGIVTDRDIVLRVLAEGKDPNETKVSEFMTKEPLYCKVDDSIDEALQKMEKNQVRRIPIIDGKNVLKGIVSQADIANRLEQPNKTAELLEQVSK